MHDEIRRVRDGALTRTGYSRALESRTLLPLDTHYHVKTYSYAGRAVQFEILCATADIVYTIRDQGLGIPETDREWLFSAFHRGSNVGDRPGRGPAARSKWIASWVKARQ